MLVQLSLSLLLLCLGAAGLRWCAGAWHARPPAWVLMLDALPLLLGFFLFTGLSARPLLGALLVATLAAGLALANAVKRQVTREPVVFADRAELVELLRHPRFYFPFAGTAPMVGGGLTALLLVGTVAWAVPPLWVWSPWPPLIAGALATAALALPGWPPLLARLQRTYEGLAPSRDPERDAARWGMLACFAIYATLARAERPARRAAPAVLQTPLRRHGGPVVMAQLESFFDPRRLDPAIPSDLLPSWDACCAEARSHGRLVVPCWGANTIRTEFTALTGLGAVRLGLDQFNPYERFALRRVDALGWRMRALGLRTICLHPFDKRFYGRHRAIPALGFERFIGPEAFPRPSGANPFLSDAALGRKVAEIVAEEGPDLFLFVISVGNHGPWLTDQPGDDPLPEALRHLPEAAALGRYLAGLRRSDAFFPPVIAALQAGCGSGLSQSGLLLAYGDHQPSLPGAFAALGHGDSETDYVLWEHSAGAGCRPEALDVEALPQLLLDRIGAPRRTTVPARMACREIGS
jgi:hypothetical protein